MATAATIDVKLELDATRFKRGVNSATAAAGNFQQRMQSVDAFLRKNAHVIGVLGESFMAAGKRMTQFISLPILGFLALLIKKAIDADTEMSKLAKGSLAKLNASLAKLGEKFLPLFIKVVDWLTLMIDKFMAADPATQKFIGMLVAMAALLGPIVSFAGWLISIVVGLGQMGITLASLGTALAAAGAFITGTLIPAIIALLPVLALVAAAALLVYLVWSNWDALKVTLSQLWFIIKFGFKQAMDYIKRDFENKMEFIKAKVKPVEDFLKKRWSNIKNAFQSAFESIVIIAMRVFNNIRNAILVVVSAIARLKAAFASIKLPEALTPGSPTPFEMGLKGINKQMSMLSGQSMPRMQAGFSNLAPAGVMNVGGGRNISIVDNRRISAGLSAEALRTALDDRLGNMAGAL